MQPSQESAALIREYLLLGLRFDRIESGYVDAFTGDPALRQAVLAEPAPDPAALVRQAERLLAVLPNIPHSNGFDHARAEYIGAHLRACGVVITNGPVEKIGALGPMTSHYCRDPDGNLIEIACYPDWD